MHEVQELKEHQKEIEINKVCYSDQGCKGSLDLKTWSRMPFQYSKAILHFSSAEFIMPLRHVCGKY